MKLSVSQSARRCACGARNRGTPRGKNGSIYEDEKGMNEEEKGEETFPAKVGNGYRVIVPAKVRRRLGLERGDRVRIKVWKEVAEG